MRTMMPIVSIVLALVAAGCIAYIAWELTSDSKLPPGDGKQERPPEND